MASASPSRSRYGAVVAAGLCSLLATTACTDGSSATPTSVAPETADDGTLLDVLREGGLVIVFRHAATDRSQPDDEPVDLEDCSTQRNLNDAGRADARAIGEAFQTLDIPVGEVWASPYCRAVDTAELAFGQAEIVEGLERLYPDRDEAADEHVSELIAERAPAAGEPNLVIAAHGAYPSVLAPAVTLAEGEAAIYAFSDGGTTLLGQVTPHAWLDLDADDSNELESVVDQVLDSVVSVQVPGRPAAGSGFRVAVQGLVVTAATVVGAADEVELTLRDGTMRTARVLGTSPSYDIAALEVDDPAMPPMHSGSGLADAGVGDPALAVGYSLDETTSWATIAALNDPIRLPDGTVLDGLRTHGIPAPDSAGGPLINTRGEVLGVVSGVSSRGDTATSGVSVIPVDIARREALELASQG